MCEDDSFRIQAACKVVDGTTGVLPEFACGGGGANRGAARGQDQGGADLQAHQVCGLARRVDAAG